MNLRPLLLAPLLVACGPDAKQLEYLRKVKAEALVQAEHLANEADTLDLSHLDLPVESMDKGNDPVQLYKRDIRRRLKALPAIIRDFNLEDQVRMVNKDYCGENESSACVSEFNHSEGSPKGASVQEIINEAKGQTLYINEEGLNSSISRYNNPKAIETPYGELSPEFNQGMTLCVYVGVFNHELLHMSGIGHAEDYGDVDDPIHALGLETNYTCLDPYMEEYDELQEAG